MNFKLFYLLLLFSFKLVQPNFYITFITDSRSKSYNKFIYDQLDLKLRVFVGRYYAVEPLQNYLKKLESIRYIEFKFNEPISLPSNGYILPNGRKMKSTMNLIFQNSDVIPIEDNKHYLFVYDNDDNKWKFDSLDLSAGAKIRAEKR